MDRSVPATPEAIADLRHAAVDAYDAAGGDPEMSPSVALAVSEACANAVCHAYANGEGHLELRAWFEDDLYIVQVTDRGVGPYAPSPRGGAGLGLQLMHRLTEAEIGAREGGGTLVRLAFPMQARHRAGEWALRPHQHVV